MSKSIVLNSEEIKLLQSNGELIIKTNIKDKVYKEATRLKLRTWNDNIGFSDGYGGVYYPEYSLEDIIHIKENDKIILKVIDINAEKINNIWQWIIKFQKLNL